MPVIIATSERERAGRVTAGPRLGCSPRARPRMGAPGQVAYPLCAMVSSSIRPGRHSPYLRWRLLVLPGGFVHVASLTTARGAGAQRIWAGLALVLLWALLWVLDTCRASLEH